jgi:hypothetical protein
MATVRKYSLAFSLTAIPNELLQLGLKFGVEVYHKYTYKFCGTKYLL